MKHTFVTLFVLFVLAMGATPALAQEDVIKERIERPCASPKFTDGRIEEKHNDKLGVRYAVCNAEPSTPTNDNTVDTVVVVVTQTPVITVTPPVVIDTPDTTEEPTVVVVIDTPLVTETPVVIGPPVVVTDTPNDKKNCNKGEGNGGEGCDPGNNPDKGNDDEDDGKDKKNK